MGFFTGILDFIIRIRPNNRHASILLVGLDNSGKTSILRQLMDEDISHATPTQGFQIRILSVGGVRLQVWDVSGQSEVRHYWRQFFDDADAIIFVVDAAERARQSEAFNTLRSLYEEEKLSGVPLLILANKQDLIGATDAARLREDFLLSEVKGRRVHVQACSAKTGEGLSEGFKWIAKQFKK